MGMVFPWKSHENGNSLLDSLLIGMGMVYCMFAGSADSTSSFKRQLKSHFFKIYTVTNSF